MSGIKTKMRKLQYWLKHDLFVFDNIFLLGALVFSLMWTWGSVSSMSRNWSLAEELAGKQREKALLELEVETLELENEYYRSTEYQELSARKYQGKMLPGETVIYLPDNSELAKNKHKATTTETEIATDTRSNFEQWLSFLFGI